MRSMAVCNISTSSSLHVLCSHHSSLHLRPLSSPRSYPLLYHRSRQRCLSALVRPRRPRSRSLGSIAPSLSSHSARRSRRWSCPGSLAVCLHGGVRGGVGHVASDRKSTRLNSSHVAISYAVCCLKNQ